MIPEKLSDIHYRMFLDLLEAKEDGFGFYADPEKARLKAVEKILKGKVKVLGFYDAHYIEASKMEERIEKRKTRKDKVFKFTYALPNEDGHFLVITKVKMEKWQPWRREE
jgi:hypothetical protein